jgi:hypothetical protein
VSDHEKNRVTTPQNFFNVSVQLERVRRFSLVLTHDDGAGGSIFSLEHYSEKPTSDQSEQIHTDEN